MRLPLKCAGTRRRLLPAAASVERPSCCGCAPADTPSQSQLSCSTVYLKGETQLVLVASSFLPLPMLLRPIFLENRRAASRLRIRFSFFAFRRLAMATTSTRPAAATHGAAMTIPATSGRGATVATSPVIPTTAAAIVLPPAAKHATKGVEQTVFLTGSLV